MLAQVDPRPYQAALLQAQGALARDQAQLDNARIDLKRYTTLLSQDSIAAQQVDTQKALVHQYEGTIKSDEAAVATQKLNLIYCRITSPVSGRVGLRQVDPGNYVTAGDTNGLVVVTEVDPMDVLFTVPEDNLAQVAARLNSGASLETIAFDRTQTTQLAAGKLLTLDNQVDTTTGTVRAKARFDNHASALFPNQFVNVRLLVDSLKGTVIVPTAAILKGAQGLFVYVVGDDATVEVRPVKTGPAAGENTAIISGLDPDEVVVTDGSDRLRDGQRVILPGACMGAGGMGGGRRSGGGGGRRRVWRSQACGAGRLQPVWLDQNKASRRSYGGHALQTGSKTRVGAGRRAAHQFGGNGHDHLCRCGSGCWRDDHEHHHDKRFGAHARRRSGACGRGGAVRPIRRAVGGAPFRRQRQGSGAGGADEGDVRSAWPQPRSAGQDRRHHGRPAAEDDGRLPVGRHGRRQGRARRYEQAG